MATNKGTIIKGSNQMLVHLTSEHFMLIDKIATTILQPLSKHQNGMVADDATMVAKEDY